MDSAAPELLCDWVKSSSLELAFSSETSTFFVTEAAGIQG